MKRTLYSAVYPSHDIFGMGCNVRIVQSPDDLHENGFLVLHGGADISPSIYGQTPNNFCYASKEPSYRDAQEIALAQRARKMGMPIVGICRGAQLLCALDGGTLVQHIEDHTGGRHPITDVRTNTKYPSNSAHHQMLKLNKKHNNILLAIAEEPVIGYEEDNRAKKFDHVPEIVYFGQMNAIGIQGHPEWMPDSQFTKYCKSLINEFLFKE